MSCCACIRPVVALLAAAVLLTPAPLPAAQPARARALYDRALELDRRGNDGAALSLLWEAAGLAPRDGLIADRLGEALERLGALDAAIESYRTAAAARPAAGGAQNHLVLALNKAGRAQEAIALARGAVTATPGDAAPWFTLGLAQSDVDVDGAVDSFQRALSIEPRHVLARYNLALVLSRSDRVDAALDEMRRARAIESRPEISYTIGTLCWHRGDLDGAVQALSDAVAANPSYAAAHLALGTVFKARGDLKHAAAELKRAIDLDPDVAAPHVVLAQTLALSGDVTGARRESSDADGLRARAARSQEAATLTAAGSQRLDADDAAGAADCFRRAIAAFDTFAPAYYQLGRALDRLGQHDKARAAFARAQQLNPALVPPR